MFSLRHQLSKQLFSTSVKRPVQNGGNQGGVVWRPALFTLLVGGVSYNISGLYAAELKHSSGRLRLSADDNLWTKARTWWEGIGAVNRFSVSVIGLNSAIFLLWRVPSLHRVMEKYFLSSIKSKSSLPILLCEFSHIEVWHLGLNMFVLWSFTPTLMRTLGDTRSSFNTWPYYITGGTFASMVGYYSKWIRRSPIGSLGASGALMAVVSLVVFNNPDASVYIVFLPFVPIPASWALTGIVALDTVGLIRGWQFFDHAGHLGGVIFAILYQWWLKGVCQDIQFKAARTWYRFRTGNHPKL